MFLDRNHHTEFSIKAVDINHDDDNNNDDDDDVNTTNNISKESMRKITKWRGGGHESIERMKVLFCRLFAAYDWLNLSASRGRTTPSCSHDKKRPLCNFRCCNMQHEVRANKLWRDMLQ